MKITYLDNLPIFKYEFNFFKVFHTGRLLLDNVEQVHDTLFYLQVPYNSVRLLVEYILVCVDQTSTNELSGFHFINIKLNSLNIIYIVSK